VNIEAAVVAEPAGNRAAPTSAASGSLSIMAEAAAA